MIDRGAYDDTRELVRKLCRIVHLQNGVLCRLASAQAKARAEIRETRLESRRQNQATRVVVYRAAANFWERPGLTQIPRNRFGGR